MSGRRECLIPRTRLGRKESATGGSSGMNARIHFNQKASLAHRTRSGEYIPFDGAQVVVAHLALHTTWIDSVATGTDSLLQDFLEGLFHVARIVPHQLGHTYASEMVRAGVGLPALMKLLGHVNPEMTMRYVMSPEPIYSGSFTGPIPTPPSRAAAQSPHLIATRRSGRCRRFAAVRPTCRRDVPSFAAGRRSQTSSRSTRQSAHQNSRRNPQTQPRRITGRDWPHKATTRLMWPVSFDEPVFRPEP